MTDKQKLREEIIETTKKVKDTGLIYGKEGFDYLLEVLEEYTDYNDGYNAGVKNGMETAWELAKKIICTEEKGGMPCDDVYKIFSTDTCWKVFAMYTPQEALAKLKAYEEQSVVKRGNCVKASGEYRHFYGIYLGKDSAGWDWVLSKEEIAPQRIGDKWKIEKTGEHVDLDSILEQIGE